MPESDDLVRDAVGHYWDALVRGEQAPDDHLDSAVAEAITWAVDQDDAPRPDPRFVRRLEEQLMATSSPWEVMAPIASTAPWTTWNGRAAPGPFTSGRSGAESRRRWVVTQLATAALVALILIGSVFVFGPGRPVQQHESPAVIPAVTGTPATPDTPVTAGPVEFLWESTGDPSLLLSNPYHLALGPDGNLWIPDSGNNQIQILTRDGGFVEAWGSPGSGDGEFSFIHPALGDYGTGAVAFDAAGTIYVADPGNQRIQKFSPDRSFIAAWGEEGTGDGQFRLPIDLAVDEQGRVYVVDFLRSDIQVFDADGTHLATWGRVGMDEGEFSGPSGIALTPGGDLWVADTQNDRIQRLSPDGTVDGVWGRIGRGEGQFKRPDDVAVDDQGRLFVTDGLNGRVQVFDRDGQFLTAWGEPGAEPGQFKGPTGIVLDAEGNIYIAEDGNDRIQKFRLVPPFGP
jgi:DNA-binding beta-propeller fold protein YncE